MTGGAGGRFPRSPDEELWTDDPFDAGAVFGRRAPLEVEVGSGKALFLIEAARRSPAHDFLGLELSLAYYRICRERVGRLGARNVRVLRADGRRFVERALGPASVRAFHVYFPDPWPKSRHQRRRLFDPETVDLVLGSLAPGGRLWFATDFLEYGEKVAALLAGYPGLATERLAGLWPEGPRTNYEAKYEAEGRPVLRLQATLADAGEPAPLHPAGAAAVVAATWREGEEEAAGPPAV
jgi:tRNA (guanine-N7-)-methyltransferase